MLQTGTARTMKVTLLRTILAVIFGTASLLGYFMYTSYRNQLFEMIPKTTKEPAEHTRFDSNMSKVIALKKLSGMAIRNIDNEWMSADDICQTGVLFLSSVVTSTLQNFTVYFHDEAEQQTTIDDMTKNGSWGKQNLNMLMKPLDKLQNAFFIDMYAGLGLYSLPIARLGLRVISIEYRYSFAERLCRGIVAAQAKDKAFIVNNLVSHETKTVNLQPKYISQRSAVGMSTTGDIFNRVSTIQLNSLLDRFPVEEAVIKIDMTEEDIDTILNSENFFDKVKIHYILMEWTNVVRSKNALKLIDFLAKYRLTPCLSTRCRRVLKADQYTSWPRYVLWANPESVNLQETGLFLNRSDL